MCIRDSLIDTAIVAILAIFMSFAMQMDALQSKGEDYLVLMLYAVIFGLTSLQSGAMIVDLTAKDKLSRRIEFFAASGIAVKEIIKQYSIQIFRFSGIIPFFVFMSCYYFTDWTMSFGRIVCVYLSILVLSFCEIVALNIIVLDVKRVKLFKNVLFFGNFALVYLIAMSAERITELVNQHHIGIDYLIIVVDVALCNGVQREHNKKLNNGLPILHKVPPKRDYGRYFCIMAEKGGTSHGGLTEKLSPFFHAKKQEVNAYGR